MPNDTGISLTIVGTVNDVNNEAFFLEVETIERLREPPGIRGLARTRSIDLHSCSARVTWHSCQLMSLINELHFRAVSRMRRYFIPRVTSFQVLAGAGGGAAATFVTNVFLSCWTCGELPNVFRVWLPPLRLVARGNSESGVLRMREKPFYTYEWIEFPRARKFLSAGMCECIRY